MTLLRMALVNSDLLKKHGLRYHLRQLPLQFFIWQMRLCFYFWTRFELHLVRCYGFFAFHFLDQWMVQIAFQVLSSFLDVERSSMAIKLPNLKNGYRYFLCCPSKESFDRVIPREKPANLLVTVLE